MDDAEQLWELILSRHRESILDAFHSLNSEEQGLVVKHLQRITSEDGWHPEQILSAQTALDVLKNAKKL